jgi:hypothetical protein
MKEYNVFESHKEIMEALIAGKTIALVGDPNLEQQLNCLGNIECNDKDGKWNCPPLDLFPHTWFLV